MISMPCSILSTFRTLVRKAGLHKRSTASSPGFTVTAEPDGCFVRCASHEVAIQYRHAGSFVAGQHRLPLDALDAIDGKQDDTVTFQTDGKNRTLLTWTDHGVPRQASFDAPKLVPFPEVLTSFIQNEPTLWRALHDAVPVTDREATRYALGCLQLKTTGQIFATDGKQAMTHAGFKFGTAGDVLLPANGLLGCKALDVGEPVGVRHSGNWICFSIGNWLVMIAEQRDGRFPRVEDILPKADAASSRLELSVADAKFLSETLPRLPGNDDPYRPITCDLNGRVLVRAAETGNARPTEVCLASSKLVGEPVTIQSNRVYIEQALRLGFRTMHLYGPDKPVLCVDNDRRYLWMLLDKDSAVKPAKDAVRIDSSVSGPTVAASPQPTKETRVTVPLHNRVATATTAAVTHDANRLKQTRTRPAASTIEQAIVLRDSLRAVAQQASELARSLKHQRRQNRIVESTLASLKELQRVAG